MGSKVFQYYIIAPQHQRFAYELAIQHISVTVSWGIGINLQSPSKVCNEVSKYVPTLCYSYGGPNEMLDRHTTNL